MKKIEAKVSALPTKNLKEMAPMLLADSREGSELVLSAVLAELQSRLPEADFVIFCSEMEDEA